MTVLLEILHCRQERDEIKARFQWAMMTGTGIVVDTGEKGRVMMIHSGEDGQFVWSREEVLKKFIKLECDILICCLPYRQYENDPVISTKLNMQYPDLNEEIFTYNGTNHMLYVGYGDYDEWVEHYQRQELEGAK